MSKYVPRQRKHKVLARERAKENAQHEVQDTNQDELLPTAKADREAKKAQLKAELRQEGAKMSGKKAKRLEKYIEGKLRKDENRELLAKLAEQQVDTSLFSSSRSMGHGREREKILFEKRKERDVDESHSSDESDASEEESKPSKAKASAPALQEISDSKPASSPSIGSGLKRPLEVDDEGKPVIQKRQKRGGVKSKFSIATVEAPQSESNESDEDASDSGSDDEDGDSDEWNGFSDEEAPKKTQNEKRSQNEEGEEDDEDESSEGSDEESDDDSDEDMEDGSENKAQRSSAFKAWAHQARNQALGYQSIEGTTTNLEIPKPDNFVPRAPEQDPLPLELQPSQNTDRKVYSVSVTRTPEIQEARLKLPVVSEEQRIMEAIHNHDVVVICGSTGSGKTTQIPQFLYESGYGSPDGPTPGLIGITQPRRVAAVSMSKRVAEELGDKSGAVAYQIRFEGTVKPETSIKFMTDGVLMREVAQDITVKKYSAIVIDEAHERSANTDILIGMLSRVIKLRAELAAEDSTVKPLKLIIMSATLRVEDMTMNPTLFATPPPVLEVEGRQHNVVNHFSKRTQHDYVDEAFRKISRGHKKLPPGDILVFLTGRNEILQLSKQLKTAFGGLKSADGPKVQINANDAPLEVEDIEFGDVDDRNGDGDGDDFDEIITDDENEDEDEDEFKIEEDQEAAPLKMRVLPLYSLLPTREQMRVFEPAPEGTRNIILATNVAETSLTIPGIRYVFDCGRSKERQYDRLSGVQSYGIGWISKASASQRSGRAGRTGPGHCYRLYSSAVYERDFPEFTDPELLRMPLEGIVLQLKAMNLQNVVNFPFPTPPDRRALAKAEKLLTYLTAVDSNGKVTPVGQAMSVFPLSPRFARILLVGHLHDCIQYTIALVAGLSVAEILLPENQAIPQLVEKDDNAIRTTSDVQAESHQANNFCYLDDKSDAMKILQVVAEFAHDPTEKWCEDHFVRFKVLKEAQQLRRQITELLRANLDAPTLKQVSALKQMVAQGFVDQVAIRADLTPNPPEHYRKPRRSIDVPYVPLMPIHVSEDVESDPSVYIHPTSPLAHIGIQECPDYILVDSTKRPKTRMHALTDNTPLITYSKPIKVLKTEGATLRECVVVPYLRAEGTGGQGWPLPAKKVKQRRVPDRGWVVE
ncbi:P-loop containing nucleoside triphosphate hydrolase protein [Fusarium venenatum]|uniref:P-loop containing nucleoside triphosphate hydrolase protein n=1 Tax=Fusarium venenatum TaxID=56646 RepID=UPI001D1BE447|nr:P-loop containing nucleoside triphosphate hydrolase protein [Fusarium venenatum]